MPFTCPFLEEKKRDRKIKKKRRNEKKGKERSKEVMNKMVGIGPTRLSNSSFEAFMGFVAQCSFGV